VTPDFPDTGFPENDELTPDFLNNAFGYHYLGRGSWRNREEFIAHIAASWPEYNQLYAHPFEWTWTNQKMRRWFAEHAR
jgi:hypothetical protein